MQRSLKRQITIQPQGGLGNQIFCFAAGLCVANGNLGDLIIDAKNIDYSHAGPDFDIRGLLDIPSVAMVQSKNLPRYFKKLLDSIAYRFSFAGRVYDMLSGFYREDRMSVGSSALKFLADISIDSLKRPVKIKGYFQDFQVISPNRDQIRGLFHGLHSEASLALAAQIETKNVIGIHLRGGDYLNSDWNRLVGTLSADYYLNALKSIHSMNTEGEIWVFTNDRSHAEMLISKKIQISRIIDENTFGNPADDFQILSRCRVIIAANSTFSFLAAYFSETARIVVVPNAFSKAGNQIPGIPENWIQIDPEWN